ncbi:MAG: N-acetyltransferase [Pseudomonadota bacterium]
MSDQAISISIATIDDIAELAKLGAHTFTEAFEHMYAAEDLAAFLAAHHSEDAYRAVLTDPKMRVWIARTHDGQSAAFASAGPCKLPVPDMPPNAGELVRLYVLKRYQSAKLGSRLLEEALDYLEAHFDDVYLSAYSENVAAQRLYGRYGFERVHDYYFMVGNHADAEYVMQRTRQIRP